MRSRPDKNVGHNLLHDRRTEGEAGLRIEPPDLGNHIGEIFVADAANHLQGSEVAPGDQIEPANQGGHRGIVTIPLLELQREALGKIARADAGRIERL